MTLDQIVGAFLVGLPVGALLGAWLVLSDRPAAQNHQRDRDHG